MATVLLASLVISSVFYETALRFVGTAEIPIFGLFLQNLVALVCIVPSRNYLKRLRFGDSAIALLSALLTVFGGQLLYWYAVSHGNLGSVSTIIVFPYEGIWGALLFGEAIRRRTLIGWGIALVGTALLMGFDTHGSPSALAAALVSGLLFTLGAAVRRYLSDTLSNRDATSMILIAQSFVAGAGTLLSLGSEGSQYSSSAILPSMILGVIVAVSTLLMTKAVRSVPLALIGSAYLVKPVFSFANGWLLFGESVTLLQVTGATIVVLGAVLSLSFANTPCREESAEQNEQTVAA